MAKDGIQRICFNFLDRCSMRCPFCFVPFRGVVADLATCKEVVAQCSDLGASVVTFCGGDPFDYGFLPDLLRYAASLGLELHVDTNGIGLRAEHVHVLTETSSLLALPIDGSTPSTHGEMRGNHRHFAHIISLLNLLRGSAVRLKINTVVTRTNTSELSSIRDLLCEYRVDRWSLYQFWPLHSARARASELGIDDASFAAAIEPLRNVPAPFVVETNPVVDRYGTYLFVDHTGQLYENDPSSTSRYQTLGSIFDREVVAQLKRVGHRTLRRGAKGRYRQLALPVVTAVG